MTNAHQYNELICLLNVIITDLFTNMAFNNVLFKYSMRFEVQCPQLSRIVFSIGKSSVQYFHDLIHDLRIWIFHTSRILTNLSSLRARERSIGRIPFLLRHRCLKRAAAPRCSCQRTASWHWSGCQLSWFFSSSSFKSFPLSLSSAETNFETSFLQKWPWLRNTGAWPTPKWSELCHIFQVGIVSV